MSEISKYEAQKKKLQGLCDEHELIFRFKKDAYPISLTIKPAQGMDAQMSMLEDMGESTDTGYISPEAVMVFAYKDGDLTYKMSETINISDSLFNKIKNLFKKMYACYMAYFFRDRTENAPAVAIIADAGTAAVVEDPVPDCDCTEREAEDPDDAECEAEDSDDFAEFFGDQDTPTE
jgi:hypothetical protein